MSAPSLSQLEFWRGPGPVVGLMASQPKIATFFWLQMFYVLKGLGHEEENSDISRKNW